MLPQPRTECHFRTGGGVRPAESHGSDAGASTLVILVTWEFLKHHNVCVFDGKAPSMQRLLDVINEEATLWMAVGASRLKQLVQAP